MKSKVLVLLLIVLFTIVLAGCLQREGSPDDKAPEKAKVTDAQVKEFQQNKQKNRVDIYIPIKEQYATSSHVESLSNLLESDHATAECYQCHSAEYFLAPPDQKPDIAGVKLSITCAVCHVLTQSEFKLRLEPLETCTSCHNATKEIVAGEVVHHPQKEMFLGYGAIGVPVIPDSKYKAGLTCIECHMPNEAHSFEGKTPEEALKEHTESICVMCHADQSEEEFAKEVAKMQLQIEKNCEDLEKKLAESKKKLDIRRNQGIQVDPAQEVYNVVYTNLSFVIADGSKGIHNFDYSTRILDYTQKRYQELANLLQ